MSGLNNFSLTTDQSKVLETPFFKYPLSKYSALYYLVSFLVEVLSK